ncbi:hypothetical protein JZ751_003906, partial [Albula glossodonta]
KYVLFSKAQEYNMSTSLMELKTSQHNSFHSTINGDIADLSLYNCTTRREIKVRSLSTPINIEFQKRARNGSSASDFSLLRSQMNIHQFNITRGNLQEAVQITVDFIRPANHTFPIMLLF